MNDESNVEDAMPHVEAVCEVQSLKLGGTERGCAKPSLHVTVASRHVQAAVLNFSHRAATPPPDLTDTARYLRPWAPLSRWHIEPFILNSPLGRLCTAMAPLKLKLKTTSGAGTGNSQPPTPATDVPVQTPGGSGLKLKLGGPKPPTPAYEEPSAPSYAAPTEASKKKRITISKPKAGIKRTATEELQSPAAKRIASEAQPQRKLSIKLGSRAQAQAQEQSEDELAHTFAVPQSAGGPRIKLKGIPAKRTSVAKNIQIIAKRLPPPRIPGNGYDSEDSDREDDPAVEQELILRMEPGEDCDYLRKAIAERTIGMPADQGGADVRLRFLGKEHRRAWINIRGRMYAAALVDMPCIIETMKSWDKKGWWKVADISQMLLVLGRINSEDEAKNFPLPPRVVNPSTMQYAHGLTPPMHWVRKRRFRKRIDYKKVANVEEEVEKLLKDDEEAERFGGNTTFEIYDRASLERSPNPQAQQQAQGEYDSQYGDEDAEGEPIDTIENGQEYEFEMDDTANPDDIAAALEADWGEEPATDDQHAASDLIVDSPAPIADQAQSYAQVEAGMMSDSAAPTPAGATETQDEESDYDESDEEVDSPDVMDEDAMEKAREKAEHLQELADMEEIIAREYETYNAMKNQLHQRRKMEAIRKLEEERDSRRKAFGFDGDD